MIGLENLIHECCITIGTLTVCENCASNYHVSCHSVSPAPPRICPKCALIEEEEIEDADDGEEEEDGGRPMFKKDEELGKSSLVFERVFSCSNVDRVIDKKVLVSCRH